MSVDQSLLNFGNIARHRSQLSLSEAADFQLEAAGDSLITRTSAAYFNVLVAIAVLIPAVVLFIGIGLMAGTVLTDRQVGVMVGAGLTNACAWLSGIWFAPGLVGGWFESVAYVLPFVYAVNTARAAIVGDYAAIFPQLWWVIGYAVVIMTTAIFIFRKKMDNDDM